jgi:hypothetical protein
MRTEDDVRDALRVELAAIDGPDVGVGRRGVRGRVRRARALRVGAVVMTVAGVLGVAAANRPVQQERVVVPAGREALSAQAKDCLRKAGLDVRPLGEGTEGAYRWVLLVASDRFFVYTAPASARRCGERIADTLVELDSVMPVSPPTWRAFPTAAPNFAAGVVTKTAASVQIRMRTGDVREATVIETPRDIPNNVYLLPAVDLTAPLAAVVAVGGGQEVGRIDLAEALQCGEGEHGVFGGFDVASLDMEEALATGTAAVLGDVRYDDKRVMDEGPDKRIQARRQGALVGEFRVVFSSSAEWRVADELRCAPRSGS